MQISLLYISWFSKSAQICILDSAKLCGPTDLESAQGYPMLVPIQHINFQGVVPFVQQYPTNQAIANGLNSYCWQGFQSYTPSHVQHQDPMETGLFRWSLTFSKWMLNGLMTKKTAWIPLGGSVTINPLVQEHVTGYVAGANVNPQTQINTISGQSNDALNTASSNGYSYKLLSSAEMTTGRGNWQY